VVDWLAWNVWFGFYYSALVREERGDGVQSSRRANLMGSKESVKMKLWPVTELFCNSPTLFWSVLIEVESRYFHLVYIPPVCRVYVPFFTLSYPSCHPFRIKPDAGPRNYIFFPSRLPACLIITVKPLHKECKAAKRKPQPPLRLQAQSLRPERWRVSNRR
jgi:hypothetical protein